MTSTLENCKREKEVKLTEIQKLLTKNQRLDNSLQKSRCDYEKLNLELYTLHEESEANKLKMCELNTQIDELTTQKNAYLKKITDLTGAYKTIEVRIDMMNKTKTELEEEMNEKNRKLEAWVDTYKQKISET